VSSAAWPSFSNPSQTPNVIAVAVLALPALAGLFAAGWPPSTTTYTVQTWFQTPSGQRVSGLPAVNNLDAWIARHHYTFWVAYQPLSHLVWLELARNGILITVAAFAVLASVWWLRIRPAD
jgi:hypothetical protein